VAGFVARPMAWRLMFDAFGLAASAGIFSVPLYAYVQESARPDERSRVIGANNIANSVLIVLLQGALVGLATQGFDELTAFAVLAVVNLAVAAYMYRRVPDFTLRFVAWVLGNVLYRQRVEGLRNVPESGPALLICNHVSFVDFLIIHGAVWRPIRFVMDREMSRLPLIRFLFAQARVIPITSFKNDPALVEKAMDTVSAELRAGNLVCIFPEGGLTWDGKLMEFKKGMERILERDPVPVVPMALNGLWGSFFSRVDGGAMKSPFRRGLRSEVSLTVGEPVPPAGLTADSARAIIEGMWQGKAA
jgi:1-acyl-sn-glycerol-3-phosphate acyltransferase